MGISPVLWQFLVKWLHASALFPAEASTISPWLDELYFFLVLMTIAGLFLLTLLLAGCQPSPQPPAPARQPSANANRSASEYPYTQDDRPGRRRSRRGRPDAQAAAGSFDFYLLNLSWSPEFCASHGNSAECGHGLGFVVHGLWPQYGNGDYPEHCSDAPGPGNPRAYTDMIPTVGLVEHEWQTHGTCSGLSADVFFAMVRRAYTNVQIPSGIGAASDADGVTPGQLLARFAQANPRYPAGSFALSCGNNRLTAIAVCLSKNMQPESCQGVRSCRANTIRVTPR